MSDIFFEESGGIATVTLSNPGKLNAINVAMWEKLKTIFAVISRDENLRCVIVRGADRNFAAGADIEEFAQLRNSVEQGIHYHRDIAGTTLAAIADCPHPTIAAIEGVCVGGGLEIACACDLRIASSQARFGIPINRLGFALAPDELLHLLQLVGKAATLEILLEGRVFDAKEARDKGLVHRVADDIAADAAKTAQRIAQGAPLAARMTKQLVKQLTPRSEPLTEAELRHAFSLLATQDYQEGVRSFLNKTRPAFKRK